MSIQVTLKKVYGEEKIYPVCDKALAFAKMLRQTTLTLRDIDQIKKIGFTVAVVSFSPTSL